ncbi:DUF6682 family protein [Aeromonas dhakensis]|uniref:phage adaptor protein n=1 Tax=Aeromonas dhakensis TaxID=196024 RepID=UPI001F6164E5|nr:DUF6682 family protein [Aeromonas dhakensis]UNU87614.1 hypothetical protein GB930_05120 [Aeromonas dhakensis]
MALIKDLLDRVSLELTDKSRIHWSLEDLVHYYNSAISSIANYRPDIFATTQTISCVAGTRQALPVGAIKLIEVERNTGGRKIRYFERGQIDDLDPEWMTGKDASEAEAYFFEPTNPRIFWLYPGVAADVKVDLVLSVLPTPVTVAQVEAGEPLQVDDTYFTPCMDWIIYRAYLRDSDETANSARGQLHLQAFAQYLGIKIETDSTLISIRDKKFQSNQG